VQGFVAPGARPLDRARALAIGADGMVRWARLDANGAFSLSLAPGQSYRILIANELGAGGLRVVGHLVMHTARGPNAWLAVYDAHPIALGGLHVAGAAVGSSGGLHTSDVSLGSSDDSSSGPDDGETQETEADQVDTCASHDGEDDDDEALDAEDGVDDHADPEHDGDDGEAEDGSPCPPSSSTPPSGPPSSSPPGSHAPPAVHRIPWGPSAPQPK